MLFFILSSLLGAGLVTLGILTDWPWQMILLVYIASYPLFVLILLVSCFIFMLFFPGKETAIRTRPVFGKTIWHTCCYLRLLFKVKVIKEGFEKLSGLKGCELVCNHQAFADSLLLLSVLKRYDAGLLTKKEIGRVPIVNRWLRLAGFYFLDRKNNREGLKTIVSAVKSIRSGRLIGVFMEGTRSKGPEMGEFHEGAFKMAQRARSPLVVCALDNTYRIAERWPWRRTTVLFKICKVIPYEEISEKTTKEISCEVREIISGCLSKAREKYKY